MKLAEADSRTLVFTSLVMMNMGLILINRSFSASLITAILKPNRSLWVLLCGVSAVLAMVLIWQPARHLFRFGQLDWGLLTISVISSVITIMILEVIKSRFFKYN